MNNNLGELAKLKVKYKKSVSELDIENIGIDGEKYFAMLHDGTASVEDIDQVQNQMLDAHSRRIQPL